DDAEVGNEMGDAADILGDQPALGVGQGRAEVAHLVDHHVVGRAIHVRRHLVGNRRQCVADDLEGDGVEPLRGGTVGGHHAPGTEMMSSPVSATFTLSPPKTTVVVPYSLTSAGPTKLEPGLSFSRS